MNVIELTKSLISCPSITPENECVLDMLQEELSNNGFDCKRYKFSEEGTDDVEILFAKSAPSGVLQCSKGAKATNCR